MWTLITEESRSKWRTILKDTGLVAAVICCGIAISSVASSYAADRAVKAVIDQKIQSTLEDHTAKINKHTADIANIGNQLNRMEIRQIQGQQKQDDTMSFLGVPRRR